MQDYCGRNGQPHGVPVASMTLTRRAPWHSGSVCQVAHNCFWVCPCLVEVGLWVPTKIMAALENRKGSDRAAPPSLWKSQGFRDAGGRLLPDWPEVPESSTTALAALALAAFGIRRARFKHVSLTWHHIRHNKPQRSYRAVPQAGPKSGEQEESYRKRRSLRKYVFLW